MSVGGARVFQDPTQSSVQPWVADNVWDEYVLGPIRDLGAKGVVTGLESWTLDLHHSHRRGEEAYDELKKTVAAGAATAARERAGRRCSCCIF